MIVAVAPVVVVIGVVVAVAALLLIGAAVAQIVNNTKTTTTAPLDKCAGCVQLARWWNSLNVFLKWLLGWVYLARYIVDCTAKGC